jgi:hypothetical protein
VQLKFTIKYLDGSATDNSVASVADQVAFERHFDRSIATLSDDFRLTDMCWLAWSGLRRKKDVGEFDDWLTKVETVEIDNGDIVPLETNQPTG